MRDLATACRAWVGLERQAFSIVEEKEPPPPVSESCTAEELRAKTKEKLIQDLADGSRDGSSPDGSNRHARTDDETTEMAALTQVTVVRDHRAAISNGRSLTMRMLTELDVATSHLGEMKREIDAGPESPSPHLAEGRDARRYVSQHQARTSSSRA